MTLKEKFLNSPCEKGFVNTNVYRAESNVKIADDYAIEFAEWVCGNCFNIFNNRFLYKDEEYSTKELLEIFKEEKGL